MKTLQLVAGFIFGSFLLFPSGVKAETTTPENLQVTTAEGSSKYIKPMSGEFLPKEQKWLSDWSDGGLLEPISEYGDFSPRWRGVFWRYRSGCPESQMRFLLKTLLESPQSHLTEKQRAGLLLHLSSCMDQSVIDSARKIVKNSVGNLSGDMLYAVSQLGDSEITLELFAYVEDEKNPIDRRLEIFDLLRRNIFNTNQQDGERFLERLKIVTQKNSVINDFANKKLQKMQPLSTETCFSELSLESIHQRIARQAQQALDDDFGEFPIYIAFFCSSVPRFVVADKFFLEHEPNYQESFKRYVILANINRRSLDWYSPEDLAYIADEYAKLAPKFADQEKALADAEAAYIAQYPDRAPVPIAK